MKILPNTIICFHEVKSQEWLNQAFESLKNNYHMIGIKDLEEYFYNNRHLKNSCHITFDDGDISFYKNAFPIIKKHKIHVSTYVSPLMAKNRKNFWFQEINGYNKEKLLEITGKVANINTFNLQAREVKNLLKTLKLEVIWEIIRVYQKETNTAMKPPMNMTERQLAEIHASGLVNIGAHTLNHPILTNETIDKAFHEIIGSIDRLSELLNIDTNYFVYPNGAYGERELDILKNKGIKLAFTTKRDKISSNGNPLIIPRSGSPFISELKNNKPYIFSKCLVQLLAGEKQYYKLAKTWSSITSER